MLLVLGGLATAGYGLSFGDEGMYSIDVSDPVAEPGENETLAVREYDSLAPDVQDAFRRSLANDEFVLLAKGSGYEGFSDSYVHYRGTYYEAYLAVEDGGITSIITYLAAGLVLLAGGLVLWWVGGRWRLRVAVERVAD